MGVKKVYYQGRALIILGFMLPIPRKKTIFRKSPKIEEVEKHHHHGLAELNSGCDGGEVNPHHHPLTSGW